MEKKKKNEELQSRRQFFKNAAKGALPILGAIALSQMPFIGQAHEAQNEMGCSYGCSGGCSMSCYTTCRMGCSGSCSGGCQGQCTGACARSCSGACSGGCKGYY